MQCLLGLENSRNLNNDLIYELDPGRVALWVVSRGLLIFLSERRVVVSDDTKSTNA